MLCFLHSRKQHTKSFNGISMKENFYLPTSDPFHSFWLNGILKTQNFKWTHWFDAIHQYTSGIEKLACRINTKFNYVINVYSNCIPGELWDLIKTEFWEEICLKVECFHFFFSRIKSTISSWCLKSGGQDILTQFDTGNKTWHTLSKTTLFCFC